MTTPEPVGAESPGAVSITRRTLNSFFWMLSGSGIKAVLRIISVVTLARLLTPEEFGVMGAALVVTGLSALFSQLGMGPALVQRPNLEDRHVRTAFTVSILLSIGLASAVVLTAPVIADFFGFDSLGGVLVAVAFLFPINGLSLVAISTLKRDLKFRTVALIDTGSYAIGYVLVGLLLAVLGFGVWSLVIAHLTKATIATIAFLVVQKHPKRLLIERTAFRDLVNFGGGFTIARLFNYSANQGDYVVAGRWLGAAALGTYTRAYQLLVFPVNLFASVLDDVLFPSMALVQQDLQKLRTAYRRGQALIAFAFMPLSVLATILAPEIVTIALGSGWAEVVVPFQILAGGMFFRAGYKVSSSVARATGAVYRQAWRMGVFAAAVVGGSWVGQHFAGLSGLAFGVLGALLVNFGLMNHLSISLVDTTWRSFLFSHVGGLKAAVLTLVVVLGVVSPLRAAGAPDLVVFLGATMAVIVAVVLVARAMPKFFGSDWMWMVATIKRIVGERFTRSRSAGSQAER